jgi:hypothetical protein
MKLGKSKIYCYILIEILLIEPIINFDQSNFSQKLIGEMRKSESFHANFIVSIKHH